MNEVNTHAEALGPAGETLDQAHERLGHTAPRVTPADIEANIASEHYFTGEDGIVGRNQNARLGADLAHEVPEALRLLTICVLVTRSGFMEVGTSAPAAPENFDPALGRKLARENAVKALWPKMGYALREQLSRVDER